MPPRERQCPHKSPAAETTASQWEKRASLFTPHPHYRLFFELNPTPMWICDAATLRFLAVNEAAVRFYGWSREEFQGMTVKDIRPPKEAPRLLNTLTKQNRNRRRFVRQQQHWSKDHARLEVDVAVSRIKFQSHDAWLAVINDQTGRKQAEVALRQSKQTFAVAFRTNTAAMAISRLSDGVIIDANKRWLALFGVSRAEVIGKVIGPWVWKRPEERRRMVHDLKRHGAFADREIHFRKANGEDFLALTSAKLAELDGERVIISSLVDMTEHRRMERALRDLTTTLEQRVAERTAALRESEERFHALATASSDVLYRMSPDWAEMRELHGRQFIADTRKPSRTWLQKYIHPDDQPHVLAVIRTAVRTRSTFELEHRVLRVDGSIGWTFSRAIPVLDAKGKIVEWLGMAKDVTRSKEAEETLHANLAAMTGLRELGMMFARTGRLQAGLTAVVDTAIDLTGADFGDVQLLEPESGDLKIVAQRGFPKWWVEFWDSAAKGKGVCGRALKRGRRIVVEDVERSRIFAGKAALKMQRKAGVRALQSTPLVSRSGEFLGMFSTHFRKPHRPDERTLALLDLLALQTADLIERKQVEEALRKSEEKYRALFESSRDAIAINDLEGRTLDCNAAGLRMLGYKSKEGLLKKTPADFSPPRQPDGQDSRTAAVKHIKDAFTNGTAFFEWQHQRRDGTVFPATVMLSRFQLGGQTVIQAVVRDITERKQAEAVIREQRDTAQRYLDIAGVILVALDATGKVTLINRKGCEVLGYREAEILGQSWFDRFVPARHRANTRAVFRQIVAGNIQKVDRNENPVLIRGGIERIVAWQNRALTDEQGRIVGTLSSGEDITERIQVEAALRESEARFRMIFNAAGDGVYLRDLQLGRFYMANLACLELLGYSLQEFTSLPIEALHRKEDLPLIRAGIGRLRRGESLGRAEIPFRRKDGSFILVEVTPTAVRLAGRDYALALLRDVTARRRVEQERALLAAIVESSNDAIYTIDPNGIFVTWAAGAQRLYGYSATEAVGKSITLIVPPDRRRQIPLFLQKLKRGEITSGFEIVRLRKDGKQVPVSVTMSPIRDATGQIAGWSSISRDISERKRLEAQLLEVGEREQHRIGHDLHDGLAQELHGLCYLARLLEKELKRELPARVPEAKRLGKVLGEAFHLTRSLAHGLRAVSPIPEGLMLSLRNLAQRTRDLYGVDCRFECRKPVLLTRQSVATHLYRIAQEAVNNAMRHGRPTQVRIQLAITPQRIILGIRDDGVGLRRPKEGHRGMGLHIMQYRADAIHGTLVVQRHPEGGTEVVCTVTREALLQLEEPHHEANTNG